MDAGNLHVTHPERRCAVPFAMRGATERTAWGRASSAVTTVPRMVEGMNGSARMVGGINPWLDGAPETRDERTGRLAVTEPPFLSYARRGMSVVWSGIPGRCRNRPWIIYPRWLAMSPEVETPPCNGGHPARED